MADSMFQDRLHRNRGCTFDDVDLLQDLPFDEIGKNFVPL